MQLLFFPRFLWLSGALALEKEDKDVSGGESLLLTVTATHELILFSVSHKASLTMGEGAREEALLLPRVVATMGRPELTRTLSRTQLG